MIETFLNPIVIVAILGSVASPVLLFLLGWKRNQRQSQAAAEKDVAEARHSDTDGDVNVAGVVLKWAQQLQAELAVVRGKVDALETEVHALRRDNFRLRQYNAVLTHQVLGLGAKPVNMPDE